MSWERTAENRAERIIEEIEDLERAHRKGWSYIERDSKRDLRRALERGWEHYRSGFWAQRTQIDEGVVLHEALILGQAMQDGEITYRQALNFTRDGAAYSAWRAQQELEAAHVAGRKGSQAQRLLQFNKTMGALITQQKRSPSEATRQRIAAVLSWPDTKLWFNAGTIPPGVTTTEYDTFTRLTIAARRLFKRPVGTAARESTSRRTTSSRTSRRTAPRQAPSGAFPVVPVATGVMIIAAVGAVLVIRRG